MQDCDTEASFLSTLVESCRAAGVKPGLLDELTQTARRLKRLSALAEITDRLPPLTRDDWCRAAAVLVHLGFGPQLVALLVEQGADVRLMPWFAAVEAHVLGDQRYLQNIPAEARQVAGEIYTAIDRYRRHLPAN